MLIRMPGQEEVLGLAGPGGHERSEGDADHARERELGRLVAHQAGRGEHGADRHRHDPADETLRPVAVQTIVKAMNGRVASAIPSQPPTVASSDGGPRSRLADVALAIQPGSRSIGADASVPAMPWGDTERGERLARIGLVVAMALSALTILLLGRHLTFWSDELDWLTFGNDFDPRNLLTPHGSHLIATNRVDLRGPAAHLRDRLPAVQDRRGRLPAGMCGARLRPRQAPDGRARRPRAGRRPALLRLGPGHDAVAARDPLHALDRLRARGLPGGRAGRPER